MLSYWQAIWIGALLLSYQQQLLQHSFHIRSIYLRAKTLSDRTIKLRGVRVNNLKDIDLDIPHGQLLSICGRSGSGKSSLAFDTLYAEGQRRYMESLSPYTRQFLEQLDKPDADSIEGIPPAIAVRASRGHAGPRSTVGTATEIQEYLQQLFAQASEIVCSKCETPVSKHNPDSLSRTLQELPEGTRYQIGFRQKLVSTDEEVFQFALTQLKEQAFSRVIIDGTTHSLEPLPSCQAAPEIITVVDRLSGGSSEQRIRESLETAFRFGEGSVVVLLAASGSDTNTTSIDGKQWQSTDYHRKPVCTTCGTAYSEPLPQMFSFSNAHGACTTCEGFGSVANLDMDLIVPDKSKTIAQGAIAPWTTPAYEHELHELLELASDYKIPVNKPFEELSDKQFNLIWDGVEDRDFGGLTGFFDWLERKKYKMHISVFLRRWKSYEPCPSCNGDRLTPESLSFQVDGKNIADICRLDIQDAHDFFGQLQENKKFRSIAERITRDVHNRLGYLCDVGLGYLQLDRQVRTLSSGESQRVSLTSSLGSTLVNMLYVLDEPSCGLHAHDSEKLASAIKRLNSRGNTVVTVDHNPAIIKSADRIVEVGPEAGAAGGEISFDGSLAELTEEDASLTGEFLANRLGLINPERSSRKSKASIELRGASGNNLKNVDVTFPLNCLCVVTGVSGAGKSSLVQQTLYPALARKKKTNVSNALSYDSVIGDHHIDEIVLVDASPVGRSPRSNPVTYIKAFDDIRKTFADTIDAKTRNLTASHFSFNVDGGRCNHCKGEGHTVVDMQFLADVYVKCSQCQGTRYRDDILAVKYRSKNIHNVLNLTVREAFPFFRGQTKVQTRLKALIDVGLEYIRLGQPATTLSSGEAQRLKLAHYLNNSKTKRALFILDEPTSGLHMADVERLVDCFDILISAGHSIITVEHNLQLIKHADWIIDIGPGAGEQGGEVVAAGPPKKIVASKNSITGNCLKQLFAAEALV